MKSITLSHNFQIQIPDNIREKLHLQAGEQFICIAENKTIRLIPKKDYPIVRHYLQLKISLYIFLSMLNKNQFHLQT